MNDSQFKEQINTTIPKSAGAQIKDLVTAIPERSRQWFLNLIKSGCELKDALLLIASPGGNRTAREYIHCRMQDNMSEIMD